MALITDLLFTTDLAFGDELHGDQSSGQTMLADCSRGRGAIRLAGD
jgi:hypothetical protein